MALRRRASRALEEHQLSVAEGTRQVRHNCRLRLLDLVDSLRSLGARSIHPVDRTRSKGSHRRLGATIIPSPSFDEVEFGAL